MGCGGACSAAFARARAHLCERMRKREREERKRGKGGRELRWRIYERPKQAANPRPFACFSSSAFFFLFFSFLFVSYSDLSASSIPGPVLPPHRAALCAHKKHSFIPSPRSPSLSLPPPASPTAACLSLNFTLSPSWS